MNKETIDKNPVLKLSFDFALGIIQYCELLETDKKFVLARQLLKSGTAIGANAIEAQNAESKRDFVHKFKVAAKEAEETQYWLLLCDFAHHYPNCKHLLGKIDSLNKVIGKILTTCKRNPLLGSLSDV